jgi:hypothetical protein
MEAESIVAGGSGQTSKITAGDFFVFDPHDGDFAASQWPTLASTAGGTISYEKAYR